MTRRLWVTLYAQIVRDPEYAAMMDALPRPKGRGMKKPCTCPLTLLTCSVIELRNSETARHRKSEEEDEEQLKDGEMTGDGSETVRGRRRS
jgi:SWI/SNF-related matrix-associated actin-dependent regulator of chromatin subfamily A member 5